MKAFRIKKIIKNKKNESSHKNTIKKRVSKFDFPIFTSVSAV